MIITSSSSEHVVLAAPAQPPQARPERAKPELPLPEPNTTISAAGQLRSALERVGAATLEPGNTSVFAPKPLSTEKSSGQNADQERDAQQRQPSPPLPPAFIPTPLPPPDIKPAKADAAGVVSLQQFISENEKFALRLSEQREVANRAAGVVDAESVFAPTKPGVASEASVPSAPKDDGIQRAPSLAASASTKEPVPRADDSAASAPVLAPLPAPTPEPAPKALPAVARELAGAVNELRTAVNRIENSGANNATSDTNDAATRELKARAERALAVVERQTPALQRVGIERNAQGALQVNEPVLQSALANAPQQVQQTLGATRRGIAAEIEPAAAPARSLASVTSTDNTDNVTRILREIPVAPRRAEAPAHATPTELPVLAEQSQKLGKTLDSIVATGVQLQRELVREDAQSSSQSSLINRLNTIANALSP